MIALSRTHTFIEDPGHGWLEVPVAEAAPAGPFSGFSPRRNGMIYLEEDCDCPRYCDWCRDHGIELDIRHRYVPSFPR
jgi:hypothetical protein